MMDSMKPNSLIIDVAIDQGGSVEGIRATSHSIPTYLDNEVIKYAVPNIPGTVATTASMALGNATYETILKIATDGLETTVKKNGPISKSINTLNGHITQREVASSFNMPYIPATEALTQ
jgi:alanine dehydrogenase